METWQLVFYFSVAAAMVIVIWFRSVFKRVWVHYNSVAVVVRGPNVRVLDPGRHWIMPGSVVHEVRLWERNAYLPTQEIPTVDGIAARYNLFTTYIVTDPRKFTIDTEDAHGAIYRELQSAMRDCISIKTCDEVREQSAEVGKAILEVAKQQLERFGIEMTSVRLLDIQLPNEIKRAVAGAELEKRLANQNLEKARAEIATMRALANAAKMLQETPGLLDLRRLQALDQALHANKGSVTIEWRGDASNSSAS